MIVVKRQVNCCYINWSLNVFTAVLFSWAISSTASIKYCGDPMMLRYMSHYCLLLLSFFHIWKMGTSMTDASNKKQNAEGTFWIKLINKKQAMLLTEKCKIMSICWELLIIIPATQFSILNRRESNLLEYQQAISVVKSY